MQLDHGAMAMVPQSLDDEIEGADGAALPVHVPDGSRPAASGADEGAVSDEVRDLLATIHRLEIIVEEETAALETGKRIDFDEFSMRKSRSMLEFVRLMRTRMHLSGESQIRHEIRRLRQKLERNRTILEMHYDAVREVATIIVRAIKEAESDGTYSATASQEGK
jgi:flagellar biosynthesis/type III secretory pathway chaperone